MGGDFSLPLEDVKGFEGCIKMLLALRTEPVKGTPKRFPPAFVLYKIREEVNFFAQFMSRTNRKGQEYADSIHLNRLCNHRRSIYPGYGHRNPGSAGMEDLPEGKVSDSVDEIDGMKCVWRKELAE